MKRIAILTLLSCALVAVGRFSPTGLHFGQAVADEDDGDDDAGGDEDDSGT